MNRDGGKEEWDCETHIPIGHAEGNQVCPCGFMHGTVLVLYVCMFFFSPSFFLCF